MAKLRSVIAVACACVVLYLVYLSCPTAVRSPQGIFLPGLIDRPYPPQTVSSVQWLLYPPAWGDYPQIGHVFFEYHDPSASPKKREELVEMMKVAAAKAGGNAIVKQQLFSTEGFVDSSQAMWVGRGLVIVAPALP
jgi:hypothetical protein